MNREKLATLLAKEAGLTKKQAEHLIIAFGRTVEEALSRGEKIVYSNFGTFYTVLYPSKVIRHPKLGDAKKMVMLPTNAVKWMPSGNIKDLVKEGRDDEELVTVHGTKKKNLKITSQSKKIKDEKAETKTSNRKVENSKLETKIHGPFDYVTNFEPEEIKPAKAPALIESNFEETPSNKNSDEESEEIPVNIKVIRTKKKEIPEEKTEENSKPTQKTVFEESTMDGGKEISTIDGAIRIHKKNSFLNKLFGRTAEDESGESNQNENDIAKPANNGKISLIDAGIFDHTQSQASSELYQSAATTTPSGVFDHSFSDHEKTKEISASLEEASKRELSPMSALSPQDISYIDLSGRTIPKETLQLIPITIARKYKVVPVEKNDDNLIIAMIDPEDIEAKEMIKKQTQCNISVRLATESDINHVLDQYQSLESEVKEAMDIVTEDESAEKEAEESQRDENLAVESVSNNAPAARIVSSLLRRAIREKSSDIHIEPSEEGVDVRFRIDGVLQKRISLPKDVQMAVISRIKILCNMKIDEQRLPQDGRFSISIDDRRVDFRVSTMPVAYGEKIVMRILDKVTGILTIEQLGFAKSAGETLKNNIDKSHGMILVTGPTGSGKTTTLYALIDRMYTEGVNIVTLEDPIEYRMPGINQSQVNHEIDYTFASGLRSIVRQDPDIIMIGEIRDGETADMAIHAALTGHVVLSTLHTNNAAGATPRLVDMGVEPFLLTSTINAIIGQRLARKICDKCKEEIELPATEIKKVQEEIAKMPPKEKAEFSGKKLKFHHGKGCKACGDTGYKGRIGLYEIMNISEEIKKLILDKKTSSEIEMTAIAQGMTTMLQDGLIKAAEGKTTIEEVWRATKE